MALEAPTVSSAAGRGVTSIPTRNGIFFSESARRRLALGLAPVSPGVFSTSLPNGISTVFAGRFRATGDGGELPAVVTKVVTTAVSVTLLTGARPLVQDSVPLSRLHSVPVSVTRTVPRSLNDVFAVFSTLVYRTRTGESDAGAVGLPHTTEKR